MNNIKQEAVQVKDDLVLALRRAMRALGYYSFMALALAVGIAAAIASMAFVFLPLAVAKTMGWGVDLTVQELLISWPVLITVIWVSFWGLLVREFEAIRKVREKGKSC